MRLNHGISWIIISMIFGWHGNNWIIVGENVHWATRSGANGAYVQVTKFEIYVAESKVLHSAVIKDKNKKVLLRERKRHTARRVVSTPSVVLPGYPPPGGVLDPGTPPGGYLTRVPPRGVPDPGTPPGGVPDPGTPPGGTPLGGYPTWEPPSRGGTWPGYPPWGGYLTWVPPWGGGSGYPPRCLMAFWEMLQSIMGYGYPPPVDRQIDGWTDACQNITFPRTTYAGGNNLSPSSLCLNWNILRQNVHWAAGLEPMVLMCRLQNSKLCRMEL